MTLTEFLLARIADDEAVARAASDGPWRYLPGAGGEDGAVLRTTPHPDSVEVTESGLDLSSHWVCGTSYDDLSSTTYNSDNDGEHIARHDPARVLAECEAKREIVYGATAWDGNPYASLDDTIRLLAFVYSDHPDYDEKWRP